MVIRTLFYDIIADGSSNAVFNWIIVGIYLTFASYIYTMPGILS